MLEQEYGSIIPPGDKQSAREYSARYLRFLENFLVQLRMQQ